MPSFLTHWHVLIETVQRSEQGDSAPEERALLSESQMRRRRAHGWVTLPRATPTGSIWHTGPLPRIDFRFPGSDISAMAFLGALAPNLSYHLPHNLRYKLRAVPLRARWPLPWQPLESGATLPTEALVWADLLHHHRSGDLVLLLLEQAAAIPAPALRSQTLAFALGYLTHLATDIAVHPYINALVDLYGRQRSTRRPRLPGLHVAVEWCIDTWLASSYFGRPQAWPARLLLPWRHYIEPAAQLILAQQTISARVLEQLTDAATALYRLSDQQSAAFHRDHLEGLRGLQRWLAGYAPAQLWWRFAAGRARWRRELMLLFAAGEGGQDPLSLRQVLRYAVRLSDRLCRRALAFYAALCDPESSAADRRRQRQALRADLRNWNLESGYDLAFMAADRASVHLRLLHNWVHFAEEWQALQEVRSL
jgi:hypothetical protein